MEVNFLMEFVAAADDTNLVSPLGQAIDEAGLRNHAGVIGLPAWLIDYKRQPRKPTAKAVG
jgi:hypothetical protein